MLLNAGLLLILRRRIDSTPLRAIGRNLEIGLDRDLRIDGSKYELLGPNADGPLTFDGDGRYAFQCDSQFDELTLRRGTLERISVTTVSEMVAANCFYR